MLFIADSSVNSYLRSKGNRPATAQAILTIPNDLPDISLAWDTHGQPMAPTSFFIMALSTAITAHTITRGLPRAIPIYRSLQNLRKLTRCIPSFAKSAKELFWRQFDPASFA
eukprot:1318582-Amorphochlora_amoeboformis.AAC.2